MAGYFVFFRLWPGFREPFAFERFDGRPDTELPVALEAFAREELQSPAVRAQVTDIAKQRRRKFNSGVKRQSAKRLGGGPSSWPKREPCVTDRQMRWARVRCADRKALLVCRLGAYLGWWRPEKLNQTAPWGPRVWVCETPSRKFAEQLVVDLNQRRSLGYEEHQPEFHFNPHFGVISDEGMSDGERASIRRCIGKIQANEKPPVEHAQLAKLIGYRAFQVAQELDAGWPEDGNLASAATAEGQDSDSHDTPSENNPVATPSMPVDPQSQETGDGNRSRHKWSVCHDCLEPLAHELDGVKEEWFRPPQNVVDDEREDHCEVLKWHVQRCLSTGTVENLFRRFDLDRAILWMKANHREALADEMAGNKADLLSALREPIPTNIDRQNERVQRIADFAWYLWRVVQALSDTAEATRQAAPVPGSRIGIPLGPGGQDEQTGGGKGEARQATNDATRTDDQPPDRRSGPEERQIMSGLPPTQRIQQIADEICSLPDSLKHPLEVASHGGTLLKEAVNLGAFDGVKYAELRALIGRPPRMLDGVPTSSTAATFCKEDRLAAAWDAAVGFLFPDWHCRTTELGRLQSWLDACEPIAGRLHAEAGNEKEKPTRHIFDLIVYEARRAVHRKAFDRVVDLSNSPVGWHIFMAVLSAAPDRAKFDDVFCGDYPGERSARGPAVHELNKQLKELGLHVNNRTLGPNPSQ